MKYVIAVIVAMVLTGCTEPPDPVTGAPKSIAGAYNVRSYDPTYGVVCYRTTQGGGPSCVKVN